MNEQVAQAIKILRTQSEHMMDMAKNNLALANWLESMKVYDSSKVPESETIPVPESETPPVSKSPKE